MTPIKQELIQLIESYALAKASGNENLQRWAVEHLMHRLNSLEITLSPEDAAGIEGPALNEPTPVTADA